LLLLSGLAVRLVYLDVPPLSFHPTRQYRSALIARGESAAALAPMTSAERDAAVTMRHAQGAIEPEIIEATGAWLYDQLGREDLRAPRVLSILAWMLGGLAVVGLVRISGLAWPPALAALAFVLFVPFGVDASRAFMPDPLMTGLTMAAMAVSLWHYRTPTMTSLLLRTVAAGAAIFVKPMAVFFLAPVIVALDVARFGLVRGAVWAVATGVLAALPAAVHYGVLIAGGNPVAENRMFTQLWTRPSYWSGWLAMLDRVIGWPALAVSLLGVALPARGSAIPLRVALAAAWVGYVAMGLVFTHHISTHDYYSLPVIPLAAASLALAMRSASAPGDSTSEPGDSTSAPGGSTSEPGGSTSEPRGFSPGGPGRPWLRVAVVAVVAILGVFPALNVRGYYGDLAASRQAAADYERVGGVVQHSARVISLDGAYGYPLAYHSRIVTSQLPLSIDRAISDLTGRSDGDITADFVARGGAFFVGTLQPEFDAQPNLRALLNQRHILLDRGGTRESWRYIVYDLTRIKIGAAPESVSVFTRAGAGEVGSTVQVFAQAGVTWRAVSADPARIRIEPASGTGDAEVRVIATPGTPGQDGTTIVSLFSDSSGAEPGGSFTVHWRTQVGGPNVPPFGYVDAPADPVTLGPTPVLFQGWALDDVQLVRVDVVARDAAGAETVLGQVVRAGRRPDVAAAHPTGHDLDRSAWSFLLDRAKAPLFRPGVTLTVLFRARDADGATASIGQRTVRAQ
jgi:hypothetical protein